MTRPACAGSRAAYTPAGCPACGRTDLEPMRPAKRNGRGRTLPAEVPTHRPPAK